MEHEQRGDTLDVSQIAWKSPPTRVIIVNWDVAVDKPNESIGIDIIVRDHESYVLAPMSTTKPSILEQVTVESLAALHATEFSCDLRFRVCC